MTDEEFKREIKGTEYNKAFITQLSNIENDGTPRPEAFKQARVFVQDLMAGKTPDGAAVDTFDPTTTNYGKSSDIRTDYLWVNDNYMGTPDWESCPSNGARNLLIEMLRSPRALARFHETILPKILPSQAEQSRARKMEDDGRDLSDLTKQIQKAYIESMTEARQLVENAGLEWGDDDERA